MEKNKYLAISALGFFLTGCAGMSKNQAALVGAATCGAGGLAGGALAANNMNREVWKEAVDQG